MLAIQGYRWKTGRIDLMNWVGTGHLYGLLRPQHRRLKNTDPRNQSAVDSEPLVVAMARPPMVGGFTLNSLSVSLFVPEYRAQRCRPSRRRLVEERAPHAAILFLLGAR